PDARPPARRRAQLPRPGPRARGRADVRGHRPPERRRRPEPL
ncbi:MAG: hypothetical protein AVDCRST_MAG30-563, partial [uncultured Solirubrobacteraceae bacterium]